MHIITPSIRLKVKSIQDKYRPSEWQLCYTGPHMQACSKFIWEQYTTAVPVSHQRNNTTSTNRFTDRTHAGLRSQSAADAPCSY